MGPRPVKKRERRQATRKHCWLPATFRIVNSQDPSVKSRELSAVVENITKVGVRLRVRELEADGLHIAGQRKRDSWIGNKLHVQFTLPTDKPVAITFLGTPIWYQKEKEFGDFPVGVAIEYDGIEEEERKKLLKVISR